MKYYKVFFPIFVLLVLIFPLLHINTAEINVQENRTLARFPPIKRAQKVNTNYGEEFESWLGDRFWGRNELIQTRFNALYKINGRIENKEAFIGDDGWMFEKKAVLNIPSLEKQRQNTKKDSEVVKKFANKLKNVQIYLMILPNREQIYQKYWEGYYRPKPRLDYEAEMRANLKDVSNVFVVNIQKSMEKNADKELMTWKDDVHLTPAGVSFLLDRLYASLSDHELKGIHQPIKKTIENKQLHHIAFTAAKLGLPGRVDFPYTYKRISWEGIGYRETEQKVFTKVKSDLWDDDDVIYKAGYSILPQLHKKLFIIGPCYGEAVYHLLKPLYEKTSWIRTHVENHKQETYDYIKMKIKEIFKMDGHATVVLVLQENRFLEELKDVINEDEKIF